MMSWWRRPGRKQVVRNELAKPSWGGWEQHPCTLPGALNVVHMNCVWQCRVCGRRWMLMGIDDPYQDPDDENVMVRGVRWLEQMSAGPVTDDEIDSMLEGGSWDASAD